jgi:hypothetical protein
MGDTAPIRISAGTHSLRVLPLRTPDASIMRPTAAQPDQPFTANARDHQQLWTLMVT